MTGMETEIWKESLKYIFVRFLYWTDKESFPKIWNHISIGQVKSPQPRETKDSVSGRPSDRGSTPLSCLLVQNSVHGPELPAGIPHCAICPLNTKHEDSCLSVLIPNVPHLPFPPSPLPLNNFSA